MTRPQLFWRRKSIERKFTFNSIGCTGAIVLKKCIAIRTKRKRHIKNLGILKRLLHSIADRVIVVLGLNHSDRDIRLVVQNVIGFLSFATPSGLAANNDASLCEVD